MTDTLHVGGVPDGTTDQQLTDLFAASGPVLSARVMVEAATGKPRGFGLVEMATPEASQSAMKAITGRILNGRSVTVRVLPPRATGWEGGNDRSGSNRSHGFGTGNGGSRW